MFSGNEWIIVVIVALVLFGGSQIPKLARSLGQAQKEFKAGIADGSSEDGATPSTDSGTSDAAK
jgi:sec-independent protein translocase protein TatA